MATTKNEKNYRIDFDRMTLIMTEYYDTMYLDGYTPYEILYATRKKMHREYLERQEAAKRAKQEAESDVVMPTLNFKSTVRVIK